STSHGHHAADQDRRVPRPRSRHRDPDDARAWLPVPCLPRPAGRRIGPAVPLPALRHDGAGGPMTAPDPVVVEDLRMSYGDVEVLHGLDLRIGRGEVVAVLGPNGAGKTTAVEILEGFRHRGGGRVSVLGIDPQQGDRAWRARIGVV